MTTMIQVENATKSFTMSYHRSLKQIAIAKARGRKTHDVFNAVDDVSFTVQEGESVGLMGLNGSGKSTLLKLISGVMRPDSGSVLTRGRIAGLIATGAGFDPQLTGRDNLYLNAAILGMSRAETDRKFDEIVDFADLGKFLDTEVAYYSSGMKARLGFAVAINVDADIFIADEALAVGDRPFKRKCKRRMDEIVKSGVTMFYVSHAPGSVRNLCSRVLVLDHGKLTFDGDVDEGIAFLHYDDEDEDDKRRHLSRWPDRPLPACAGSWRRTTCWSRLGLSSPASCRESARDYAISLRHARTELTIVEVVGVSTGNYTIVVTHET
jgi:ABC-2 type transport system ATP-binding protein